jgi:hypothetical protein
VKFKFSVLTVTELVVDAFVVEAFDTTKLELFPKSVVILAEKMLATVDSRFVITELVEKMLVEVELVTVELFAVNSLPVKLVFEIFSAEICKSCVGDCGSRNSSKRKSDRRI